MFDFKYISYRVERFLANRTKLGRFFLNNITRKEIFFDGQRRLVAGYTSRLLRLWRTNPVLRHESELSFNAYQGGDVLDIGAFHGWYSLLLSPKAVSCSLVSFEPDSRATPSLLRTLADLNQIFPNLRLFSIPQPIGDGVSQVTAEFPAGEEGHPRYGIATDSEKPLNDSHTTLKTLAIDHFVSEFGLRPAFVKVDVEGAEYQTLLGMKETLKSFHPTVMLEIHPDWLPDGVSVGAVYDLLLSFGYKQHPINERQALWDVRSNL